MPSPKSRHIARGKPHIIRYKGIVSDGLGSNRILDFGFWEELAALEKLAKVEQGYFFLVLSNFWHTYFMIFHNGMH